MDKMAKMEKAAEQSVAALESNAEFSGGAAEAVLDNRAASVAQRKLSDDIATSPRVNSQRAWMDALYRSPRVTAQRAQLDALGHPPAQRRASGGAPTQSDRTARDARADASTPNRTGLPDGLKTGIESLSGMDMSDVRVHFNSAKPAQLQALAYAQGTDIHVGPGQEQHLAHEAWHVVQQKQGRVRPTIQMFGNVQLNADLSLEREADVMGREAMQRSGAPATIGGEAGSLNRTSLPGGGTPTVQAKFMRLTEERIYAIQEHAQANGENLDAEYLQGLYVRGADVANNDPPLFFKVGVIPKSYFTGERGDALSGNVSLFTSASAVSDAEKSEADRAADVNPLNRLNALQVLARETDFYDQNEGGPVKLVDIQRHAEQQVNAREGEAKLEDLVRRTLTGGVDEGGGGYGAIEFRFQHVSGLLFLSEEYQEAARGIRGDYPRLEVQVERSDFMRVLADLYSRARLPYAKERASEGFVYIESSLLDDFTAATRQLRTDEPIVARAVGALNDPSHGAALPAAPIAVPKVRRRDYTYRAPRGSRDAGQKAAMGGYSARDYVARFSPVEATQHPWEWLHIQGSRLGGPNRPENLVAGTAAANTHMIPYERTIYELSTAASNDHPVAVTWTSTVRQDAQGRNTHVGKAISIDVAFPQGAPAENDRVVPAEAVKLFPATFEVSDGAPFTKIDRDVVDSVKSEE